MQFTNQKIIFYRAYAITPSNASARGKEQAGVDVE